MDRLLKGLLLLIVIMGISEGYTFAQTTTAQTKATTTTPTAKTYTKSELKKMDEVKEIFLKSTKLYMVKDLDGYMKLVAPDPDIVFYGSQEGDKAIGKDAVRKSLDMVFKSNKSIDSKIKWMSFGARGNVVWLCADCDFTFVPVNSEEKTVHFSDFLTQIWEKRGTEWLIVNTHISRPDQPARSISK